MTTASIPSGRTDADKPEQVRVNPDQTALGPEIAEEAPTLLADIRSVVRERPLAAVAIVATVAYL